MTLYKLLSIPENSILKSNNPHLYIYGNIICNTQTQQVFTNILHPKHTSLIKQFNLNPKYPLTITNHKEMVLYYQSNFDSAERWWLHYYNKKNLLVKTISNFLARSYHYDHMDREILQTSTDGSKLQTIWDENGTKLKQIYTIPLTKPTEIK